MIVLFNCQKRTAIANVCLIDVKAGILMKMFRVLGSYNSLGLLTKRTLAYSRSDILIKGYIFAERWKNEMSFRKCMNAEHETAVFVHFKRNLNCSFSLLANVGGELQI